MIRLFRTSSPINIFFLAIITLLLRVVFAYNLQIEDYQPFTQLLQNLLVPHQYYNNLTALANVIIAGFLVFIQALLFNLILNKHNLLGKQTYLPSLIYVCFCSLIMPFLILSVPLICNFFLLYIFNKLLLIYKQPDAVGVLFDIGLVIGIATIIYFPLICLLLFVWLCLIVLRPFYWREWISAIIAFITILFFLAVYYYFNQNLFLFLNMWQPFKTPVNFLENIGLKQFWVLAPLTIALLLALLKLSADFFRSVVLVRKGFIVLLFLAIVLNIAFCLNPYFQVNHFMLLAIPFTFLLAYYFLNATKKWIYESIFIALLALTVFFQLGIY